ncbi:MAG TPA: PAS domain S-box protein [Phycisphaerae bacterium]|nr:PAS domain S-box protein [Phycisphaerae bacterium]
MKSRNDYSQSVGDAEEGRSSEREALARLQAVVGTAVDGIITIDDRGVIESVNPAVVRLFGYSEEELIGQNVRVLMPEPFRGEHDRYLSNYRETGERKIIGIGREVRGRRRDGSVFPLELAVSETWLGERRIFTGMVRDISARVRSEQALRESEERFAAFMRYLPGAAWMKDLSGRYVYANLEAEAVFNTPLEHLRGKTDEDIFPVETARQFRENDRRAIEEGGSLQTIEVLQQKDGVTHRSMVRKFTVPGYDGEPAYVAGVAFDITDWLAAEEGLRASEERFRRMADSAPVMIWMSGTDRRCTWFNRSWLTFTGRTLTQELGEGWLEVVHPDDRERCMEIYVAAFNRRDPFEMEFRHRRYDGEYRWVLDAGVPLIRDDGSFTGYIGSCLDITDRRRSEEILRGRVRERAVELAQANERLREEVEQRRRAETLLAHENHILELVAAGGALGIVLETLCHTLEELMPGAKCVMRLPPHPAPVNSGTNGRSPVDPRPISGVDIFGSHAVVGPPPPLCGKRTIVEAVSGDRIGIMRRRRGFLSYWIEPILAPNGDLLGVVAVYGTAEGAPSPSALASVDAVVRLAALALERASAEERARHQLAQLAHVSRLATMGEMASGLAHELNQPLCAIVNFAEACVELVQSDHADPAELQRAFSDVAKQAERAGEVIRRLREFVRRRTPERQPIDPNDIVREVLALTQPEARRDEIQVRLKLASRPLSVMADPIQLQQVMVNLVRNACDAMRQSPPNKRVLTIQTAQQKDLVEVQVSDSGAGVPEPLREKLFEPFFSTKHEGLGLGLSISRSILEVHSGRIWATPNGARGTTFHFTLPSLRRKKP